jgi:hypothetical protein
MNYISCIIKILELPTIESFSDSIEVAKFRVQLPYIRNKKQSPIIINSQIWGKTRSDLVSYYRVNDYALVEGYLSISSENKDNQESITINIIKLYPFLFELQTNKSN